LSDEYDPGSLGFVYYFQTVDARAMGKRAGR